MHNKYMHLVYVLKLLLFFRQKANMADDVEDLSAVEATLSHKSVSTISPVL